MGYKAPPLRNKPIQRLVVLCVAVICLVLGAITLPLPLPTGLILLSVGFALLLMVSRRTKIWFRRYRRRSPWLDQKIGSVEHHLPDALRRALSGRPGSGISSR